MMMDYDDTTGFLGQWGRFQQTIFFLLCGSIICNGIFSFSIVFLTATPRHHCQLPEVNLTEEWRNASIPIEVVDGKQELSRCSRYRLDVVRNLSAQGFIPGRDVNLTDLEQEGCVDGWSYSKDIYQSTIVTEFDLVCSDQWKQPFTSLLYYIGVLLGAFFSGQLSDRFGRKPVIFASLAIRTIFIFAQRFAPIWEVLCIFIFIIGFGHNSFYIATFVLGTEILTGSVRAVYSGMGAALGYSLGNMMLPLFAYFLRDWKSLVLVVCLPFAVFLPLLWFIPESPRWLLSKGRVEDAEAIVRKAARMNKVEAPRVIFKDYTTQANEKTKTQSKEHHFLNLLRTTNIRCITFIMWLLWLTVTVGYYGLSLNTVQLHADPYVCSFLSAVVEVPAYISCWLALRYFPRRLSISCTLLAGGVSLYFIQLVPQSLPIASIALEMLGKYAITCSYSIIYAYTAEIYPTVLRNTAAGTCTTVSRLGACVAPFLLKTRVYFKYLPYIILGTLSVVAAFATLFLPESFRRPLPQTIQQMHNRESIKCAFITGKEHSEPAEHTESGI